MVDTFTPMGVKAIRFSRLLSTGEPDWDNPRGGFLMCGGTSSMAVDAEIEAGADIFIKDASGAPCIVRKRPDLVKRFTFTLTLCKDAYEISEILGIASAIESGGEIIGRAYSTARGCTDPELGVNAVGIELWGEKWDCDTFAGYFKRILPNARLVPAGQTLQDGETLPVYNGYTQPNDYWFDGPFGDDSDLASTTGWALVDIDEDTVPTCENGIGYVPLTGGAS